MPLLALQSIDIATNVDTFHTSDVKHTTLAVSNSLTALQYNLKTLRDPVSRRTLEAKLVKRRVAFAFFKRRGQLSLACSKQTPTGTASQPP